MLAQSLTSPLCFTILFLSNLVNLSSEWAILELKRKFLRFLHFFMWKIKSNQRDDCVKQGSNVHPLFLRSVQVGRDAASWTDGASKSGQEQLRTMMDQAAVHDTCWVRNDKVQTTESTDIN